MIQAEELRIGNLILWNPKLVHPNSTLPAVPIEVFAVSGDKISYVFPNIENRVEPFEDDRVQPGTQTKLPEELEPIPLTEEIMENTGFIKKGALLTSSYFEKEGLQLKAKGDGFQQVSGTGLGKQTSDLPVKYFHQLQNLYFAFTGNELEIKLHGQQT